MNFPIVGKILIFHGETPSIFTSPFARSGLRNIHARVFKSSRRKLAIVAFRGTQFESAKNWHVDADIQRIPMTLGISDMGILVDSVGMQFFWNC
jgi:hypothetical protein